MARFNSVQFGEDAYIIYAINNETAVASYSYVDPSMRGRGVGKVLVKEWKNLMIHQGYRVAATCGYVHITLERLAHTEEE